MILLKKLNGKEFILNCDLIENIQENPDTTIRLTNGNVFIVQEPMRDVLKEIVEYKQTIFSEVLYGKRDYSGNTAPEEPDGQNQE